MFRRSTSDRSDPRPDPAKASRSRRDHSSGRSGAAASRAGAPSGSAPSASWLGGSSVWALDFLSSASATLLASAYVDQRHRPADDDPRRASQAGASEAAETTHDLLVRCPSDSSASNTT